MPDVRISELPEPPEHIREYREAIDFEADVSPDDMEDIDLYTHRSAIFDAGDKIIMGHSSLNDLQVFQKLLAGYRP